MARRCAAMVSIRFWKPSDMELLHRTLRITGDECNPHALVARPKSGTKALRSWFPGPR